MQRFAKLGMVIMASLFISACGLLFGSEGPFRDRSMDYKKAETYPRMEVSQDVQQRVINDYHPVPPVEREQGFEPTKDEPVPRPRMLIKVLSGEGVEIRRDEDKDWLWLEYPPDVVWPVVKSVFSDSGVELVHEDDAKGQLETAWLKELPQGDNSYFDGLDSRIRGIFGSTYHQKYRVDLVTNKDRDVTGLLVSRAKAKLKNGKPEEEVDWQTQSEEEDLRAEVVQKLGEVILAKVPQMPGTGLVQDENAKPRIVLTQDGNGYPVLVIGMDFTRAWEAVGLALREADIPVADLNRSLSTYYLKNRYTKGEDEPEMIELKLNQGERSIYVAVQKDDNTLVDKPIGEKLLAKLKDELG